MSTISLFSAFVLVSSSNKSKVSITVETKIVSFAVSVASATAGLFAPSFYSLNNIN